MSGLRSLRGLGARLLGDRPGQSLLATAGIALGVALFTGTLITTTTATRGVDRFITDANGQADVIATPPGGSLSSLADALTAPLPDSTVGRLRALPGVADTAGAFSFPSAFEAHGHRTAQKIDRRSVAAVVGTDLASSDSVMPVDVASGRLPTPGAPEVAVPERLAAMLDVGVGDRLTAAVSTGHARLTVVAVLAPRGLGRLSSVAVTSLPTARRLAGATGGVTQVAVDLRPGVDAARWVALHRRDAPSGVSLTAASASLGLYRQQLGALNGALQVSGAGMLLTAGFLIYLTLAMAVAERTRLYGTLQALGATGRQVRRVVVAEALAMGVAGSAAGVMLGIAVAKGLSALGTRLLDAMFGSAPPLVVPGWTIAAGLAVGVAVTLVSALVPAHRATSVDPVAAIRETPMAAPARSGQWITGAALVSAGAGVMVLRGTPVIVSLGIVVVSVGAIRLVPVLLGPLAGVVGPLVSRLGRGVGRVAVLHLVTERARSAYTLALVMVVMAMTIATATGYTSFAGSLTHQLDVELGHDLQLTAASTFPPGFLDAVRREPGVAAATARAFTTAGLHNGDTVEPVYVRAIDPATYFDTGSYLFVDGGRREAVDALRSGPSIILGTPTAKRLHVGRGDAVTIDTPAGAVPFRVAATAEISNIPTVVYTSADAGRRYFGVDTPAEILVRPWPGTDPEALRRTLVHDLSPRATFLAATAGELKADNRAQVGGGINAFFALLLLAGVVGMFGLANTLAVSIGQRHREIGVLRAIGARRRQVQAMAVVEAVTLVAVAFILALPLGVGLSRPLLATTNAAIGDLTTHYRFAWGVLPILAVAGLAVALIAAYWPARRAAGIEIDAALRFE